MENNIVLKKGENCIEVFDNNEILLIKIHEHYNTNVNLNINDLQAKEISNVMLNFKKTYNGLG